VKHLEAFSSMECDLMAISRLAVAHLLGSIGNSSIDSEALGKILLGLGNGGGA